MRGSRILIAASPRGFFMEGTIVGTGILPGTAMQLVAGTAPNSGRFSFQPYNPNANGDPRLRCILLEDERQGQLYNQAYTSGARCFMYCPLPGDEMNILVASQVGTGSANAYTIGERLIPQNGATVGGQFISTATSSVSAWFMCLEHVDIAADTTGWVWAQMQ